MAETKRRLPNWMLKPHTESKSGNSDSNPQLGEKSECQNEIKPSKPKQRRKPTKLEVENSKESEVVLQKCVRNRKNGAKRKNGDEIGNVGGKRNRKNVRKFSDDDEIEEFSPKFSDDDEIELTVDDLVSIAEEYVNADKEKQRNETSTSTTTTENNKSKNGSKSIQDSLPNSNLSNFETTAQNNCEEENVKTNVVKTGDAAQDMLDLFLGPLLKKTGLNKEPSFEPSCSTVSFERSEREIYGGEKMVGDEILEKKKSSLKDKVALFLD